jgi:hypothetical protein
VEPFDDELSQQELDELLKEWQTPPAPRHLRQALFPAASPWWRRIWTKSIRVPLPVACALAVLFAAAAWRLAQPGSPAPIPTPAGAVSTDRPLTFEELRPVSELRPRIIRRQDEKN